MPWFPNSKARAETLLHRPGRSMINHAILIKSKIYLSLMLLTKRINIQLCYTHGVSLYFQLVLTLFNKYQLSHSWRNNLFTIVFQVLNKYKINILQVVFGMTLLIIIWLLQFPGRNIAELSVMVLHKPSPVPRGGSRVLQKLVSRMLEKSPR